MFKMILSAVFAMGLGSVAFAADPAANTGTTDTMNKEMPTGGGTDMPATDNMKKEHKGHMGKEMADGKMMKTKKMKHEKKTTTTEKTE